MQLRSQLVKAAQCFCNDSKLSLIEITNMFQNMAEQFKLLKKWLTLWTNQAEKFMYFCCSTMWENRKSFYARVQKLAKRKEEVEIKPIVNVIIESVEYIFPLIEMNYLVDNTLRSSPSFLSNEELVQLFSHFSHVPQCY